MLDEARSFGDLGFLIWGRFTGTKRSSESRRRKKADVAGKMYVIEPLYWGSLTNQRSFGSSGRSFGSFHGMGFKDHSTPMISGMLFVRNMSSGIGSGEKIELLSDMAGVLGDKGMEVVGNVAAAAPAVSEVAVAAADSWLPVAALQYAIDGVHNFTGCNWWVSIVITTLIIRTLSVPIMINQLKATSKLTILRPELEAIKQEMQDKGMSPSAVAEGQTKMKAVFTEHGVSTFTPLKGLFIQGPVFVSFFLA
ncbi:mitochondrial inner membrane protein OXA1-like protein, partial [Tanacetum coccineum]